MDVAVNIALILVIAACVVVLCLVRDEKPSHEQRAAQQAREGRTTAMPVQVRPSVPMRRR